MEIYVHGVLYYHFSHVYVLRAPFSLSGGDSGGECRWLPVERPVEQYKSVYFRVKLLVF